MVCGIEDHDVGPHILLEDPAIRQTHALSGKRGKFANRILKRELLFLANILAQDARKCAIGARMRMLFPEQTFGRGTLRIVIDRNPGLLKRKATSGSDMPKTATSVKASSSIRKSNNVSIGSLFHALATSGQGLPLKLQELGILNDADHDRLPGRRSPCHSLSQSVEGVAGPCGCVREWRDLSDARRVWRRRRREPTVE